MLASRRSGDGLLRRRDHSHAAALALSSWLSHDFGLLSVEAYTLHFSLGHSSLLWLCAVTRQTSNEVDSKLAFAVPAGPPFEPPPAKSCNPLAVVRLPERLG